MTEMPTAEYPPRTARNVAESDATLIVTRRELRGGTGLTARICRGMGRPLLVVSPDDARAPERIRRWLGSGGIRVLNVAGPRESESPGIHAAALRLLLGVL